MECFPKNSRTEQCAINCDIRTTVIVPVIERNKTKGKSIIDAATFIVISGTL